MVLNIINWILNLAGVLLWFNWRSDRLDPLATTTAGTLAGNLRRAGPRKLKRVYFLPAMVLLVVLRAVFYRLIGPEVDWTASVRLGQIAVAFRSDNFTRMLVFSTISFLKTMGWVYLWLLCLSFINGRTAEGDPVQRVVRMCLGWWDRLHWFAKLVLPFFVAGTAWLLLGPLLAWMGVIPPLPDWPARLTRAGLMGCQAYLSLKYLLGGILALFTLMSYVYLGRHPLANYVTLTGKNLLGPFRRLPLQVGKVDFSPVVAVALIFLAAELAERLIEWSYRALRL